MSLVQRGTGHSFTSALLNIIITVIVVIKQAVTLLRGERARFIKFLAIAAF